MVKNALFGMVVFAACGNQAGNIEAQTFGDRTFGDAEHGWFAEELDAACGEGGLTSAGGAIERTPYLQQVTDHSAMLLWTAEGMAEPTVSITDADGVEVATVPAAIDDTAPLASGSQYTAVLTDLEPGSIYCYEISDGTGRRIRRAVPLRRAG
jgi:hypothetical protein